MSHPPTFWRQFNCRCSVKSLSRNFFSISASLLIWGAFSPAVIGAIPAFPGAQGFGAYALGGRNGDVYHVTNLNPTGPGSFADAIATVPSAGRTIVFDVSGYIRIPSGSNGLRMTASKVTIAGQTAPGDGIAFHNNFFRISGDDIVIRHLRFRHGYYGSGGDCIDLDSGCLNAILDHVSLEFSTDENISSFGSPPENLTMQYSLNAWGLESHSCGGLWDQNHATSHHSLWAHNHTRNPKSRPTGLLEWINNVTFDWDIGFIMGDTMTSTDYKANVIGNYFIGPAGNTHSQALVKGTIANNGKPNFTVHLRGNLIDINGNGIVDGVDNGYAIVEGTGYTPGTIGLTPGASGYYKSTNAIVGSTVAVVEDTPLLAYKKVVSSAGALRLDANYQGTIRDEVDTILLGKLTSQARFHVSRESTTGASNGGFGILASDASPIDTDRDGMPDFYEDALGWSKSTDDHALALASSGGVITGTNFFPANTPSGYTRLEEYLHFLSVPHATVAKYFPSDKATSFTVNLQKYTGGFSSSPAFSVANVVGGTVSLSGVGNAIATFTPSPSYAGRGRFEFTVTDSQGDAWTQTFAVVVGVALPRDLLWKGAGNTWDTTSQTNWLRPSVNSTVVYADPDRVTFDDSGIAQSNVIVAGSGMLSPTTIDVDASGNYTLSGTGAVSGPLAKRGAGTLTISNTGTNKLTPAVLEEGTLSLPSGTGLGGGMLTMSGGMLKLNISHTTDMTLQNDATVVVGGSPTCSGSINGSNNLDLSIGNSATLLTLAGSMTNFSGTLSLGSSSATVRINSSITSHTGSAAATFDLGNGSSTLLNRNGNPINLGALRGGAMTTLSGAGSSTNPTTYSIGANNASTTFFGKIINGSGATAIAKVGVGTLSLAGSNNYTGSTTVSAGELQVAGSLGNTAVTVASGAKLSGTGVLGGSTGISSGGLISPGNTAGSSGNLTVGSLSLNAAKLIFDLSGSAGGNNDHIQIASGGPLAVTGAQTFQINPIEGVLNAGTYKLIETTGTLTASGAALNLGIPTGSGSRQTFNLLSSTSGSSPGYIQLVVTGNPASLVWSGSTSVWNTSSIGWNNSGAVDRFYNFDAVIFNNTASNRSVSLAGLLQPRSIVVTNSSAQTYNFSGPGRIGGITSLTKTGNGTLTISIDPSVTIASSNSQNSSTVTVADASPLAVGMLVEGNGVPVDTSIAAINSNTLTLSSAVTSTNGGTSFVYSWKNTYGGGTIIGLSSVIVLAGENANAYGLGSGPITLNGGTLSMFSDTASYNSANYDIVVPAGQNGRLNADARCDLYGTLEGAGTFNYYVPYWRTSLYADWSAFTGVINVLTDADGGDFRMSTSYAFPGFPHATVNLSDRVSMYFTGILASGGGTTIEIGELSGGALSILQGGATGGRNFTYRIGGKTPDGNEVVFAGRISEQNTNTSSSFVKTGSGSWKLTGACSWNGGTIVESGTLNVAGSLTCKGAVNVNSGSALKLSGGTLSTDAVNIGAGAVLSGIGTINGDLNNDSTLISSGGGELSVTGDIVNNGLIRISGGTSLKSTGSFVNNGILDLMTAGGAFPQNLVNNGSVIDSSSVKVKDFRKNGNVFTVTIDSHSGHGYQLQRTASLTAPVTWENVGFEQTGSEQPDGSPTTLTFTDSPATGNKWFYRFVISP